MKKISFVCLLALIINTLNAQIAEKGVIPISRERSRDFDVVHYRIQLTVDLNKKYLDGQNTISLVPLRDGLRIVRLDAESLKATRVLNSNGSSLNYKQTDDQIIVDLGKTYDSSDSIAITVKYYRFFVTQQKIRIPSAIASR